MLDQFLTMQQGVANDRQNIIKLLNSLKETGLECSSPIWQG